MFSLCFLNVSWYFSIIRHLSREPDFSAKLLLESIDYHEAARKASFLGSMCEDSLMAAIHFERRFDALMKYVINS